jgi:glutamyl-Q tRNA(Asp) synthetase
LTEKADKPDKKYRGRFAPSPTGRLHFGSLVTAVGSYLDARHHQGEWLVRIEDIDPPREVPGAADDILRTLERFGMEWDGPVIYQSKGAARYESALVQLEANGHLYGCACTRREIADSTLNGKTNAVYPGTCRNGIPSGRKARSLRLRLDGGTITLNDRLQGITRQSLHQEVGDFIVRRADQQVAYQLAVVVDDAHQEMTHIVRGVDLLDSTPRQICLQQLLQLPTPEYLHLPLATDTGGDKLSKQTHAHSIDPDDPVAGLRDTLLFLQQELPDSPGDARLEELWQWAIDHWDVTAIPACRTIPAPGRYYL